DLRDLDRALFDPTARDSERWVDLRSGDGAVVSGDRRARCTSGVARPFGAGGIRSVARCAILPAPPRARCRGPWGGRLGGHWRRGPLCGPRSFWPAADPRGLVLDGHARVGVELLRAGSAAARRSGCSRAAILRLAPGRRLD